MRPNILNQLQRSKILSLEFRRRSNIARLRSSSRWRATANHAELTARGFKLHDAFPSRFSRALFSLCLLLASTSVCVRAQESPSTTAANPSLNQSTPLTLDDALRLAASQASTFQQAALNERIAAEDVKQAQAAFLPRVNAPLSYLYTSPALGLPPGTLRVQSFLANNAINEYQAYLNVAGDIDVVGKLRATVEKNRALLAAAHAGTEVARRALAQAVVEAYYGLALASVQRRAAEQNLAAAEDFERITSLLLSGGRSRRSTSPVPNCKRRRAATNSKGRGPMK